jgi:hypothetical protein
MKLLLSILLSFSFLSCQRYLAKNYNEEKIKTLYAASLDATTIAAGIKQTDDLISTTIDSSNLKWTTIHSKPYVLAVMWKKASDTAYYKNDCTTGFYNTGNRYNFVTLAPQLSDICREKKFGVKEGVNLRLEQLLGLPEKSNKFYFVEVWVQPQDLIRPCYDTGTDDRSCNPMPGDTSDLAYKAYLHWLNSNNTGYPFTRMGYTYDWNPRNPTHEGVSEFLIEMQSKVVIKSLIETCDYCYVRNCRMKQ